jgi:hypothetical protein
MYIRKMDTIFSACLISQVQSCQIKACQKVSELMDALYLHCKHANYHRALTKDFRLHDISNYKRSKVRSDCKLQLHQSPTSLCKYPTQVTD